MRPPGRQRAAGQSPAVSARRLTHAGNWIIDKPLLVFEEPVFALQILELIVLAALAAVVLYNLYAVLGRKVGRGPEDAGALAKPVGPVEAPRTVAVASDTPLPVPGLSAVRARDAGFDPENFLAGAKKAYRAIVEAFATGDRATLAALLSPTILTRFEAAIAERETAQRTERVEVLNGPRADLENVWVEGDTAKAGVRFLAELRTRTVDAAGEAVEDRRTAELWTFQRSLKSRDPNWTLIHVDVALA
jgi:predicted lipid-binding transport protein (Tim44 family)